jgi:hypothetical protein
MSSTNVVARSGMLQSRTPAQVVEFDEACGFARIDSWLLHEENTEIMASCFRAVAESVRMHIRLLSGNRR